MLAGITVVLGAIQAVVWANLAPGQQFQVFADGSWVTLPTADYHPFVGLMLFVFSGAAVGLVVAVAAWRVRAVRGTATLLTLFAGTAAGSAVAFGLGLLLSRGVNPASVGKTGHNLVVVAGPSLSTPLAMIAEPLVAVVVYTFLAAWDGRPDLGRKRVVRAADRAAPAATSPTNPPATPPAEAR